MDYLRLTGRIKVSYQPGQSSDYQERLVGNRERLVTAGETDDSWERLALEHAGVASHHAVFVRGQPTNRYEFTKSIPPGPPERGGG